MRDVYDRLEAAIQDWIREKGDEDLILTDWSLSTAGIRMQTADETVEYNVGGSGAAHSVLGLARLAVKHAEDALTGGDDDA